MFKSIYEFTKMFSILFFLMAAFFAFKSLVLLAILSMISFVIIRFINSDWAFDKFKFTNHNMFVIGTTFFLIFANIFFIYQELRYSPIFVKVKKEDQENYVTYENDLYEAINPCVSAHNTLMEKKASNSEISSAEVKNANMECFKVVDEIDKQIIPNNFSSNIKSLCFETKDHFKKIAINLATYSYSNENPQTALSQRVKDNLENAIKKMSRIRVMMHMSDDLDDSKKGFINL